MNLASLRDTSARQGLIAKLITLDDDHPLKTVCQGACRCKAGQPCTAYDGGPESLLLYRFDVHGFPDSLL
jgi:hypothetical protein